MADIQLHLIDPTKIDAAWARSVLSIDEKARADRFVFPDDARRWTCVRAECRRHLAAHLDIPIDEITWEYGAYEKPSITGHPLAFNLSHSKSLSALAIATKGPLGVDLEPEARGEDLVADLHAFCHPEEIARLPDLGRARALIELWTAKEAFLKALGTGLSQPPEQVSVDGRTARGPVPGLAALHLIRPRHPALRHHALAIAAPVELGEVEVLHHHE
ncbi:4'-phosphopantetheinyl transferase family protein [Haloferula rosea]|uniref:4'-phosphopantetheinyl transferase superfamily protein n=1 Tax=Haloferula rosea TaxID=490093 RepID=A0A934RCL4_9BACT|nr:4'-phosphopantetheinyl transferase superfamily protein [Haloferula rosea]MBK1828218.1 4'-phosphopantetheinyl transferase superfamily protein [Haloferula rosea]